MFTRQELYSAIVKGGYSVVQELPESRRIAWFGNYINDILLKDVQTLARIEGLTELPNLLKLVALRAGHIINRADLARLMGLSASSLQRYLTLMEALYLIQFCPAWRPNKEKRLIKSPRAYLIDTSVLTYLQGITAERMLEEPLFTGHILENFVWQELAKQATWSQLAVSLFHFRTTHGPEVDIVIEDVMGRIVGIEIKNSNTVREEDFKGLAYLESLAGKKFIRGIVMNNGAQYIPFGQKMCALPFSCLWQ